MADAGKRKPAAARSPGALIDKSSGADPVEKTAQAKREMEQLMAQMREANERLVLVTLRAQTMLDDAKEASHLKDELLATVSHELRTPLSAILGWARMVAAKKLPPEAAGKAIETIERNASMLARIIDDLLDVSRIVTGTLHLTGQQPVDVVAVARAALEAVQPLAASKNVQLEFSPDSSSSRSVSGDAGRLQQVIWNLLVNAIKFTPDGGRVTLVVEPAHDHIEIRVVDTGEGIAPDFLPHVFEAFWQNQGTTAGRQRGLGLGLAIVRRLVELHGGTVHAASEGAGRGAAFTVGLPLAGAHVEAGPEAELRDRRSAASASSPKLRLPRLDHLRILVVDDDDDGRTLTSLVFAQAGARVAEAASAREAFRAFEEQRPDVLVSDIGLPDEDGYALIRHIREYEAGHGGFLPAVALTGFARAEDRDRILAAGFQAHVRKPVDSVELATAIATVTQHREPAAGKPTPYRTDPGEGHARFFPGWHGCVRL